MDDIQCNTTLFYNTYESTLKKLIQILKSKTSDNVKQLEDLWDSVSNGSLQPANALSQSKLNSRTSPTISSSSQSPIHLSDSSNDSTNSNGSTNNLKREASKMCPSPVNSTSIIAAKKVKLENTTVTTNGNSYKLVKEQVMFTLEDPSQSKADVAVDMLDITCTICKNFNQEPNNKLIECRQCTLLYHQLCHNPVIGNDQLEQHKSNDDQMVWYMSKCNKCEAKYENEQVDLEVDKINSAQEQQQQQDDKKTPPTSNNKPNGLVKSELKNNDSWSFKKTSPTNINTNQSSLKSSPSLSLFSNLSNHNAINNNTLNSSSNTINSNGKTTAATTPATSAAGLVATSSSNGIKGLAGLATKLNPNSTLQANSNLERPNSTTSTTSSISNKKSTSTPINHDSLFKKFKESASSNSVSANENEKSNTTSLAKKALVSLQVPTTTPSDTKKTNTTTTTTTTTSNGVTKPLAKNGITTSTNTLNGSNTNSTLNNLHKKNPFNISNSLTTKTSNTPASNTTGNASSVGLNNLKEKKTQLKTSTSSSITANSATNATTLTRSSKIS